MTSHSESVSKTPVPDTASPSASETVPDTQADRDAATLQRLYDRGLPETPKGIRGSDRTRARILTAATELFQQQGYKRTSIDQVAQRAHVAKGSVYVHFESKPQLLIAAIAEEKKAYAEEFRTLILDREQPPAARITQVLKAAFHSLANMPLARKLISGDHEMYAFLEEMGPKLRAETQELQVQAMTLMLRGVGRFDALSPTEQRERVLALIALMYSAGVAIDDSIRGGLSFSRYADVLTQVIVHGIGG